MQHGLTQMRQADSLFYILNKQRFSQAGQSIAVRDKLRASGKRADKKTARLIRHGRFNPACIKMAEFDGSKTWSR